jgi:acetyltransferase-like isoleucine patch superfamily enzyme/acyl carrier protein
MATLSSFLRKQRARWYRRGIDRRHGLRRFLAYYVVKHGFEIGDYSSGAPTVHSWGENARLKIGKYCSLAEGAQFLLGGNHRTHYVSTFPFGELSGARTVEDEPYCRGDIIIGSDVWIAKDATILSGVTIGDGAVVGAGSVVLDDVQPYTIVQGNPARLFGKRFPEATIQQLLKVRWWDLEHDQVMSLRHLLQSENVGQLIEACCKLKGISVHDIAGGSATPTSLKGLSPSLQPTPSTAEQSIITWCTDYIAEVVERPASCIDPNTTFERLGVDSVMRASLMVALEEAFNVTVTSDDIAEMPTISALAQTVAERRQVGQRNVHPMTA